MIDIISATGAIIVFIIVVRILFYLKFRHEEIMRGDTK